MSDPRGPRSRRALLDAFLALLKDRPIDSISAGDIAAAAGVSRATLFRHFANKEALLEQIARSQIDTLVALTLPVYSVAEPLPAFQALCDFVDAHRVVWKTLLTGGAAPFMRDELLRLSAQAAKGNARAGEWLPVDLVVSSTTSAIIEGLTWWLSQKPGKVSKSRAAVILHRLVLQPVPPA